MNIETWLRAATGGDTQRAIARKTGIQQSKLSRQISTGTLDADVIRDIARAYGHRAVTALIEHGFLDRSDLPDMEELAIEKALGMAKNSQMLAELDRRIDPEARRIFRGEDTDVIDLDDSVRELHPRNPTPGVQPLDDDDLAAAIEEANQLRGAAQYRTGELTEPDNP